MTYSKILHINKFTFNFTNLIGINTKLIQHPWQRRYRFMEFCSYDGRKREGMVERKRRGNMLFLDAKFLQTELNGLNGAYMNS